MHKKAKYTAVVIGARGIGSALDSPTASMVLTHAHAFSKHPSVTLAGFYDRDQEASVKATRKWGGQAFKSYDALARARPDIISICTPDASHFAVLKRVAEIRPKLVICEKPLSIRPSQSKEITRLYQNKKIPILVNYVFLFDPFIQEVREAVVNETYGKTLCATSMYAKGILHNGPHIVSMAQFLFGNISSFNYIFSRKDSVHGHSVSFSAQLQRCPQFIVMVGDGRKYFNFEFDIFFEKRRIHVFDNGLRWLSQDVRNDKVFNGYKTLGQARMHRTSFGQAFYNLVNNAVSHLKEKEPLRCDMYDAMRTEQICYTILRLAGK